MKKELVLSQNEYKEVFLAHTRDGKKLIVRKYSISKLKNWDYLDLIEEEAQLFSIFKLDNLPQFIQFTKSEKEDTIYFIKEYIEGTPLLEKINSLYFKEKEIIELTLDFLNLLEEFHQISPKIILKILDPKDIIITPNKKKLYLVDLKAATSRFKPDFSQFEEFMAPEILTGDIRDNSDIYSLGMLIIFLLSHKCPTEMERLHDGRLNFRKYLNVSTQFCNILDNMIEENHFIRIDNIQKLRKKLLALIKPSEENKKETVENEVSSPTEKTESLQSVQPAFEWKKINENLLETDGLPTPIQDILYSISAIGCLIGIFTSPFIWIISFFLILIEHFFRHTIIIDKNEGKVFRRKYFLLTHKDEFIDYLDNLEGVILERRNGKELILALLFKDGKKIILRTHYNMAKYPSFKLAGEKLAEELNAFFIDKVEE